MTDVGRQNSLSAPTMVGVILLLSIIMIEPNSLPGYNIDYAAGYVNYFEYVLVGNEALNLLG